MTELANVTGEPSLFLEYLFLSPPRPVGLAERGSQDGRKSSKSMIPKSSHHAFNTSDNK